MTSNCLNVFDRIYLINLEKRKDRLDKWLNENDFIISGLTNFEIVKAIDGKELPENEFWLANMGALGCLESHLNILKDVMEKGYQKVLIFEDDFKFDDNFEEIFKKGWDSLPSDWDMLYLYAGDYTPPLAYNEHLMKLSASLSTVAYAITAPSIPTFIHILERRNAVDVVYAHLHFLINAFKFKNNICHHYDGFSDVINNYSKYHHKPNINERLIAKLKRIKVKYLK